MEIKILGRAGFANDGAPFNAFLIDGHVLVETPPDILQSLQREKVDLADIDTVVITHFHGDHCFGLPFLLFNLYLLRGGRQGLQPSLIAPAGLKKRMRSLLSFAISPDHPYVEWSLSAPDIRAMREGRKISLSGGLWLDFFRTEHSVETYAILAGREPEKQPRFIATSDTKWSPRLAALFAAGARLILCDSGGGEGNDDTHLKPREIEQRILPLVPAGARLLATHYKAPPGEGGVLRFVDSGDRYVI